MSWRGQDRNRAATCSLPQTEFPAREMLLCFVSLHCAFLRRVARQSPPSDRWHTCIKEDLLMAAPSFTWRSPPPYYFRNKTLSRETRSHCWFLNLWHFGRLKCPFLFCLAGAFFFARCFWGFPRRFASSSLSLSLFLLLRKNGSY